MFYLTMQEALSWWAFHTWWTFDQLSVLKIKKEGEHFWSIFFWLNPRPQLDFMGVMTPNDKLSGKCSKRKLWMQKKDAASDNIDKTACYDNDDQECLLRLGFGGFMLILARDRGAGAQGASQDDRPGSGAVQRGAHAYSKCC